MGRNKLLLPWGDSTVLEQTLIHARASQLADVIVVTGYEVEAVGRLPSLQLVPQSLSSRLHPRHAVIGASGGPAGARRVVGRLVVLGDQPMVGAGSSWMRS